jgi:hypothetical protein
MDLKKSVINGRFWEISILDMANTLIDFYGKKGEMNPLHVEPRPAEVKKLISDTRKTKELRG